MSGVGDAFLARLGRPDPAAPNGLHFADAYDQQWWAQIHAEIGSGWYQNRFLYLFGEGLDTLEPCLTAWSFLVPAGVERMIVGRNAYGALLVAENPSRDGYTSLIGLLDPLNVR